MKNNLNELLKNIRDAPYSTKTDKQLHHYENLSQIMKEKFKNGTYVSPSTLIDVSKRGRKLTKKQVSEIRKKYVPKKYGKIKLSKEYKVSPTLILKIIKNEVWKSI